MTYEELKEVMDDYHMGKVTRLELIAAIALWQRKSYGIVPDWVRRVI